MHNSQAGSGLPCYTTSEKLQEKSNGEYGRKRQKEEKWDKGRAEGGVEMV